MSEVRNGFHEFIKQREIASRAYVNGDSEPLADVVARVGPTTHFGSGGGYRRGPEEVWSDYVATSQSFEPGGKSSIETLQMGSCDRIGYWVGFQKTLARLRGKAALVPINLRITEIFRREKDGWKLIHRHSDRQIVPSEAKG
jgi:ketosteroid isomerase-like protein